MIKNLKALSGRLVLIPLEEHHSDLIHLPENRVERAGELIKCRVLSSGCEDVDEGSIVYAKTELGYRVPMCSSRIYLLDDVLLIES